MNVLKKNPILFWLISSYVVLFLFIAPFSRGLFNGGQLDFLKPIYVALIWSSIILLVTAIHLFSHWKAEGPRTQLLHFAIWLIPLAYLLSLIQSASHSFAVESLYIHLMYASFFLLSFFYARQRLGAFLFQGGILLSGYVVIVFGLMNWFGNASLFGLIHYQSSAGGKAGVVYRDAVLGQRLSSVFQYPNTYAAYLIALIIASIVIVSLSRRWYVVMTASFMLVPGILSFLLTLSRGGMVVFPVVVLLVLPFLTFPRQILFFVHTVLALLASLSIFGAVTHMGLTLQKHFSTSDALKAWSILIMVSLLYSGFALLVQRYLEPLVTRWTKPLANRRFSTLMLPVIALLVGAIGFYLLFGDTGISKLLPDNIKNRIANINLQQTSVAERGTFYKDAIKLFKDYPVLGAGGGAWFTLYEKYQSNPYVSRQAHNFFLQYLVETGLVGLIFLVFLLAVVFYTYIRSFIRNQDASKYDHLIFYIVPVAILIHSLIDFDMSFIYIGALVFLSLGGMLGGSKAVHFNSPLHHSWQKWTKAYPAFMAVVAVLLLVMSVRLYASTGPYNSAMKDLNNKKPLNQVVDQLDRAIDSNSYPEYAAMKANLLLQAYKQTKDEQYYTEATSTLDQLGKLEPYNHLYMEAELNLYAEKQNWNKVLEVLDRALNYYPWDITIYERIISLNYQLGHLMLVQHNKQKADQYWNRAIDLYQEVKGHIAEFASLPKSQAQIKPFQVSINMALNVGKIFYSRNIYMETTQLLKKFVNIKQLSNPQQQELDTYYLAALRKQGKDDPQFYNLIIQAAPEQKEAIEALMNQ